LLKLKQAQEISDKLWACLIKAVAEMHIIKYNKSLANNQLLNVPLMMPNQHYQSTWPLYTMHSLATPLKDWRILIQKIANYQSHMLFIANSN